MGGACSCDDTEEEYTIVVRQVPIIAHNTVPPRAAPLVTIDDDAPPRSYSAFAEFPTTTPSPLTLNADFDEVEF